MTDQARESKIISVDSRQPDDAVLAAAGAVLRRGGLVAFPTETVYGLGANAWDARAVQSIFRAKGRPADNPLIVHLAHRQDLAAYFPAAPARAAVLADLFWPGPLTLVLRDERPFPAVVTAGLATVAVRVPDHPVARALIRAAGVPVAAPSANLSGRPSPTTAQHVQDDLGGVVEIILDGGPAGLGLESTVLDLTLPRPVILRPGGITRQQLADVLGPVDDVSGLAAGAAGDSPRSPGLKYKHYAPRAELLLFEGSHSAACTRAALARAASLTQSGKRVAVLAYRETEAAFSAAGYPVVTAGSRHDPGSVAANLYRVLRQLDQLQPHVILAQGIPAQGLGRAVMDRLRRAAAGGIVTIGGADAD